MRLSCPTLSYAIGKSNGHRRCPADSVPLHDVAPLDSDVLPRHRTLTEAMEYRGRPKRRPDHLHGFAKVLVHHRQLPQYIRRGRGQRTRGTTGIARLISAWRARCTAAAAKRSASPERSSTCSTGTTSSRSARRSSPPPEHRLRRSACRPARMRRVTPRWECGWTGRTFRRTGGQRRSGPVAAAER